MRGTCVVFVRLLRIKNMKYGVAVDEEGKRWRGFYSNRSSEDIRATAVLGAVGLCKCCGDRVFQGWECLDEQRDACVRCVTLPRPEKVFISEPVSKTKWKKLRKEFFEHEDFNLQRRDESGDRPGS